MANIIAEKFKEKYAHLKVLEIVYSTVENTCTISFLYHETASALSKESKEELLVFLTDYLALNAKVVLKFQKSYLDAERIAKSVQKFFQKNHSSLASVMTQQSILPKVETFGVTVTIVLPEEILANLSTGELATELNTYLSSQFIANFDFAFNAGQNLNHAEIAQNIAKSMAEKMKDVKTTVRFRVFNPEKVVGMEIAPEPEFIANQKDGKSSVILAGVIQNFEKKTYKRVRQGKEVEKTYFKFSLQEENKSLQMIYFAPKAAVDRMEKLCDGTQVLVVANLKKDRNFLTGYIKSLSLCEINDEVRRHSKEKITAYQCVFPQKYKAFAQGNMFDVDKQFDDNVKNNTFVVFDVETTGLDADSCEIIEIGAVKVSGGEIIEKFQTLVRPKKPIPSLITTITEITDEMVKDAPPIEVVIKDFYLFAKGTILSGYNVNFDMKFIQNAARLNNMKFENEVQDVLPLARQKLDAKNYKLGTVVKALNLTLDNAHRAFFDALATAEVLLALSKIE